MGLRREDLRAICEDDLYGVATRPVSDSELAELGYVKVRGGIDGQMVARLARQDSDCWCAKTRKPCPYHEGYEDGAVALAEMADGFLAQSFEKWAEQKGLVQRPVCGECEGSGYGGDSGHVYNSQEEYDGLAEHVCRQCPVPCPSCAGSGFGRLVALDGIDVEALRCGCPNCGNPQCDGARRVLAALDQEDTP